jgi:hypothetical protein
LVHVNPLDFIEVALNSVVKGPEKPEISELAQKMIVLMVSKCEISTSFNYAEMASSAIYMAIKMRKQKY